jgi:hypothetical protein
MRRELDEKLYSTVVVSPTRILTPMLCGKEKQNEGKSKKSCFPQDHALRAIFGVKAFWPS